MAYDTKIEECYTWARRQRNHDKREYAFAYIDWRQFNPPYLERYGAPEPPKALGYFVASKVRDQIDWVLEGKP